MQHHIICVTGGTGFVGQAVVAALLENGYRVRALIRNNNSAKKLAAVKAQYPQQLEFITGDATDANDVRRALEGSDAMVHLVGIRREETKRTGLGYAEVDLGSAVATTVAMEQSGIKRILFLSAGAIGKSEYVKVKAQAEQTIINAKLDWTIFRPAFITGPGQQWPLLMSPILNLLRYAPGNIGSVARLAGNISRKQLAHAFVAALENDQTIGEILEVPELRKMLKTW